jgi:hypothetical protein
LYAVGFDQGVQGETGSALSLAPAAVAAMDEHWFRYHAIAHEAARATAVKECGFGAHGVILIPDSAVAIDRKHEAQPFRSKVDGFLPLRRHWSGGAASGY